MEIKEIFQLIGFIIVGVGFFWKNRSDLQEFKSSVTVHLQNHKERQQQLEREILSHKNAIYQKMDDLSTEVHELSNKMTETNTLLKMSLDNGKEK